MYLSILALPMFGSAVAGLRGRSIGVTGAHIITTGSLMLSAVLAIIRFYEVGLCGSPVSIQLFSWIDSEFMLVTWGFLFDSLTVSMNTISQITLHSSLIPVFSIFSITKRRASIYKPKHVWPSTTSTGIVVWNGCNILGSTLGYKISRFISHSMGIPTYYVSVLVGMLLGDASVMPLSPLKVTSRVSMGQSIVNFPYLWFVWDIIGPLCQSLPYVNFHTLGGKVYLGVVIRTRGYAALTLLLNQFIVNGVKCVRSDIYNLLTPVVIAHWIMCDGGRLANGLVLCTDSYTIFDVVQLINVLVIKYDIYSTINYNNKQPRIYINRINVLKLRSLVVPHMCKFSLYKLGL